MIRIIRAPIACCVAVALALGWTTAAAQDATRVLILPVEVESGDEMIAFAMTRALEQAAQNSGREPTVSSESRDSIAAIAGCAGEFAACVDAIAATLAVDEVLYGQAARVSESEFEVRVVHLAVGQAPVERLIAVDTALAEEVGARLAPEVEELLRGALAEPEPAPVAPIEPLLEAEADADAEPVDSPPAPGFSLGRVGIAPWAAMGGGAAIFATGVVLGAVGQGKQSEIDGAPTETVADLEALEKLESDADTLTGAGNALMIAGGVAVVAGLGWAVYEATRQATRAGEGARGGEPTSVTVMPAVGGNAVGLVISLVGW